MASEKLTVPEVKSKQVLPDREDDSVSRKYRAPALEKGLDILILLSDAQAPLSVPEIAAMLGRSTSELFRIVQVLAHRGFVERNEAGSYRITNHLFKLGMRRPPVRDLTFTASPFMRALAKKVRQSCYLTVLSRDEIVVIYRVEPPGELSMTVQIGYRESIATTTSGVLLYAFQPSDIQHEILEYLDASNIEFDKKAFLEHAKKARRLAFATKPSKLVRGVTDYVCPILEDGKAIAALKIPYVDGVMATASEKETLALLKSTAASISDSLLIPSSDF